MLNWVTSLISDQKPISQFNWLMAHTLIIIIFSWMQEIAFIGIFSFTVSKIKVLADNPSASRNFSSKKIIYGISLSHLSFACLISLFIAIYLNWNAYPTIKQYFRSQYIYYFEHFYIGSYQFVVMISVILIIILHNNKLTLGFQLPKLKSLIFIFFIVIISFAIMAILSIIGNNINDNTNIKFLEDIFWYAYGDEKIVIADIFIAIVYAPIIEELFFRSIAFQYFKERLGLFLGLIVSSIFFTIVHLGGGLIYLLIVFIAGMASGLMFHKTKSIYVPIIFHSVWNTWIILNLIDAAARHFGGAP